MNNNMEIKKLRKAKKAPFKRSKALPGRNDLCPCGSKKKFKNCCQVEYRLKLQKHVTETRAKQIKDKR